MVHVAQLSAWLVQTGYLVVHDEHFYCPSPGKRLLLLREEPACSMKMGNTFFKKWVLGLRARKKRERAPGRVCEE
jgi:hypothetical protein